MRRRTDSEVDRMRIKATVTGIGDRVIDADEQATVGHLAEAVGARTNSHVKLQPTTHVYPASHLLSETGVRSGDTIELIDEGQFAGAAPGQQVATGAAPAPRL